MIYDIVRNFGMYCPVSDRFTDVAAFLKAADCASLPVGRQTISNNGAYALVSEYTPVETGAGFIESHERFIDIQIVLQGAERIGFCAKSACRAGPYDPEKDFQKLEGVLDWLTLRPGFFAIFFPGDGHMPKIRCREWDGAVKKLVIKVPVSLPGVR